MVPVFLVYFTLVAFTVNAAEKITYQRKRMDFEDNITDIAEKYIGIPYEFGKGFKKSAAVDNSHLFYLIYDEASREAGLRFKGYMPMKKLLSHTAEVQRNEIKKGDLIVLKDGHAAMIYRIDNRDKFYMIYASLKRKKVITFNSQNVVFNVYWLVNLKCFRRLTEKLFLSDD